MRSTAGGLNEVGVEAFDERAWEDRAVSRSLERARAEAAKRSRRIVCMAMELSETAADGNFTLQAVADRAGISTRTFYQHFSSKDELLVALFEESQAQSARLLEEAVSQHTEPLARLREFILTRQRMATRQPLVRQLVERHFRLQESHPEELRHAMEPVTALLKRLIGEAASAGVINISDTNTAAALVMNTLTIAVQSFVLGSSLTGVVPDAEDVYEFCIRGLAAADAGAR
ncbi:transcriptional regulatory protein [Mycobacterium lentiflavum]|uniref:Transcriptional regulatory protein n=1 Tax=Mycobacterium lentiflavum TaxID=141349 RepID=A0A0E4CMA5_MYCLN|nr:TetR/AcrR family transcriptional regulator [Mycobacterium lentiflavum]CQD09116.1 transcriptional regulatory protein [Mycobacterium lentiflavum]